LLLRLGFYASNDGRPSAADDLAAELNPTDAPCTLEEFDDSAPSEFSGRFRILLEVVEGSDYDTVVVGVVWVVLPVT
jgi:hypothetical protein